LTPHSAQILVAALRIISLEEALFQGDLFAVLQGCPACSETFRLQLGSLELAFSRVLDLSFSDLLAIHN
jgi:hypothetical protein